MNPDQKNQKQDKADYDFILNQGGAEAVAPHKGPNKKIVAIIVLVVVTALIIIASLLLGASQNAQPSSSSDVSTEQKSQASDLVGEFLSKVEANDLEGAYTLFSAQAVLPKDQFIAEAAPFLQTLKLAECQPQDNNEGLLDEAQNIIQLYNCKTKTGDATIGLQFSIKSDSSGQLSIYGFFLASPTQ